MADNTAYQDLLKDTSESKENGNYFLVTITDLDPNKTYPIQFRWTYKDKKINDNWSAVKLITTPGESEPNTPAFGSNNVDVSSPEKIIITWDGTSDDGGGVQITNYDRVDVYIDGAPFDGTKAAYSFKAPGTTTIAAPAGDYTIVLYAISKTGKSSPVSSPVTVTVEAAGVPIEDPTLPSGLSVATAPFAVTVNWNGTYASSTFTGFKSIDIYAVGSDLGSSVTSGISSTNLVGSLTVNDTTNRINVGLDNLRQALGLSSNSDVYNATIFYYYNAVNTLNVKYGSPTYTRINSSSVVPTKANYVDLANGVISIENLVAGNGNFSSWLRTGTAGGARIELSGVTDFTNNGYTVQKGLVAYSSGNTELFNLDLDSGSLTINGSGTFTGNLSAGSGNSIFKSDSSGIYLGNASYASAPFSVSRNGLIKAESGTIGGWTLGGTYLQGNNLKLDTSGITVGATTSSYFDISPTALVHRNSNGTASGKFTLTLGASPQLTIDGTITVGGSAVATSGDLSTGLAGKVSNGGVSADSSFTANNIVYKINGNTDTTTIDGGKITTGTVTAKEVISSWIYAGDIAASQITAGTLTGFTIQNAAVSPSFKVTSTGDLTASSATITGTINATSGYIGSESTGWKFTSSGYLYNNGVTTILYPTTDPGGNSNTYVLISDRGISVSSVQTSGNIIATGTSARVTAQGSSANRCEFNYYNTIQRHSISSGYGVDSDWSPQSDNTYDLGQAPSNRWRRLYSNNTTISTSDARLKTDIVDSPLGLDFINSLRPVSFRWINGQTIVETDEDGNQIIIGEDKNGKIISKTTTRPGVRKHYGFIAQEVKEAIDNSGVDDFAGWVKDDMSDPESTQSLSYEQFVAPLTKAVQELSNKINQLSARLDALEA